MTMLSEDDQFKLGMVRENVRLLREIERLRALIEDGCMVFEHYDLPEHAFHYRRALNQQDTKDAVATD